MLGLEKMKSKVLTIIKDFNFNLKSLTYNIAYAIFTFMEKIDTRIIRENLNLTQEEFAEKIGVAFCTVNRWEKGHSNPSKLALKEIAKFIKIYNENKSGE